jgi:predicted nucleic acid-binding protein
MGLLGVLLLAKERAFILQVGPLLEKLESAGFYLDETIRVEVLRVAREL